MKVDRLGLVLSLAVWTGCGGPAPAATPETPATRPAPATARPATTGTSPPHTPVAPSTEAPAQHKPTPAETRANSQQHRTPTKKWRTVEDVVRDCKAQIPIACLLLAKGGTLQTGPKIPSPPVERRRYLLLRACQFDSVGDICFAYAVEEYLNKEDLSPSDWAVTARTNAAYMLSKACQRLSDEEMRQGACAIADSIQQTLIPGDVTGLPFPKTVAGFALGSSRVETRKACGQEAFVTVAPDWAACVTLPVDPFFEGGTALVRFCDDRACEVGIVLGESTNTASRVLHKLKKRYGEPMVATSPTHCAESQTLLVSPPPDQVRMNWLWHTTTGAQMLAFMFECRADSSVPELIVWYRNQDGVRARLQERETLDANY